MFRRRRAMPRPEPTRGAREVRLQVDLGRTDLDALTGRTERLLQQDDVEVVLSMSSFMYFDALMLDRLTALVDRHRGRLRLEGTDVVAETLLPEHDAADDELRDRAIDAVTELNNVLVVTLVVSGRRLTEAEADAVFAEVVQTSQPLVTIDFLGLDELSPALTLAVAELSGDLAYRSRTLLCVNAAAGVAAALRIAGLSGATVIQATDPG